MIAQKSGFSIKKAFTSDGFDKKYAYRLLILLAILAAFVMYVDIMLTPSLPAIGKQYGVDSATASLIISLYLVFGTAMMPVVGKLGDIFGKKIVLISVLVAYSAMVAITSFTSNFSLLLLSRTFQGIGLSIFPIAFSLVREEFPRELVPRAQGLLAGMFGGGVALGLPAGAYVANSFGWQANYHIALPFIVILTVLLFFVARESSFKDRNAKLDYVGAIWLGLSLAMIVMGISEGPNWGWSSFGVLFMIIAGAGLLIPLAFVEQHIKDPILNIGLLTKRNVLVANAIAILLSLAMYLAFLSIAYEMEGPAPSGFGFDILTTGLYLLPLAVSILVVAYPVGILISKFGVKRFIFLGAIIGAVGFFLLSTANTATQMAEYLVIAAVGLGVVMVATQNLLVLSVDPHEMGLATSLNSVFRNLGASIGTPIVGSILSTFTATYTIQGYLVSLPSKAAFQYSFYIAIAGFLAVLLFSIFAKEIDVKPDKKRLKRYFKKG